MWLLIVLWSIKKSLFFVLTFKIWTIEAFSTLSLILTLYESHSCLLENELLKGRTLLYLSLCPNQIRLALIVVLNVLHIATIKKKQLGIEYVICTTLDTTHNYRKQTILFILILSSMKHPEEFFSIIMSSPNYYLNSRLLFIRFKYKITIQERWAKQALLYFLVTDFYIWLSLWHTLIH